MNILSFQQPALLLSSRKCQSLCARVRYRSSAGSDPVSYLQKWIGSNEKSVSERPKRRIHPQPDQAQARKLSRSSTAIRNITGKSYLVPTFFVERGDTPEIVVEALRSKIALSPLFFQNSPVVLDMSGVSLDGTPHTRPLGEAAFLGIVNAIKRCKLIPCGVANASDDIKHLALEAGIPSLLTSSARVVVNESQTPPPQSLTAVPNITVDTCSKEDGHNQTADSGKRRLNEMELVEISREEIEKSAADIPFKPVACAVSNAEEEGPIVQQSSKDTIEEEWREDRSKPCGAVEASVNDDIHATDSSETADESTKAIDGDTAPLADSLISSSCAKFVEGSIRSGQQVYAQDSSLVILGSVNSGAEVLADGDIHVYGKLGGRALAGVRGNREAKIFVQSFDAELISIADAFMTIESASDIGVDEYTPTMIVLEGQTLKTHTIGQTSTRQRR